MCVADGDLPTRTSSQWVMALSKEGSYPLYFLKFIRTIRVYNYTKKPIVCSLDTIVDNQLIYFCLLLPPRDCKLDLTYVTCEHDIVDHVHVL